VPVCDLTWFAKPHSLLVPGRRHSLPTTRPKQRASVGVRPLIFEHRGLIPGSAMHIPIYAGRKYEASYTGDYWVEYACPNCRYECDVEVRAKGLGTGHTPYFTDDGGAREEAVDNAQYASAKNARCTVKLLACPRSVAIH